MYSIYFMKIKNHTKWSFHCSDFWPPLRPAATTYTKDGATCRVVAEGEAWSDTTILGILGIYRLVRVRLWLYFYLDSIEQSAKRMAFE